MGRAARAAASAAADAVDMGRAAAFVLMADKLLVLIEDAQLPSEKQTGEE